MKYSFDDKKPLNAYRSFMADKYERCEIIPWWKAPVKVDYIRDQLVCTIIGFHILFRIVLNFWNFFQLFGWDMQKHLSNQLNLRKKGGCDE